MTVRRVLLAAAGSLVAGLVLMAVVSLMAFDPRRFEMVSQVCWKPPHAVSQYENITGYCVERGRDVHVIPWRKSEQMIQIEPTTDHGGLGRVMKAPYPFKDLNGPFDVRFADHSITVAGDGGKSVVYQESEYGVS